MKDKIADDAGEVLVSQGWYLGNYDPDTVARSATLRRSDGRMATQIFITTEEFGERKAFEETMQDFGRFHLCIPDADDIHHVEKYFVDPMRPLPEEAVLFELEFGHVYPVKSVTL